MINESIKTFRENKNMTQAELAEKLYVTRQAVSNWETGKSEPDIDTLNKIAVALDVSIEELIYGFKRETTVIHNHSTVKHITKHITKGISFGAVLAMVISYVKWQSIGWAILRSLLNWVYVMYFVIRYGWS